MKLNIQMRIWQLSFSPMSFLSNSIIQMTAFALSRRMWNAYYLFPFFLLFTTTLYKFSGGGEKSGFGGNEWMGVRRDLCWVRKETCLEKVGGWGNLGHRFRFQKKKLAAVTLITHSSRNGLPLASAGWDLYVYSVNRDDKLWMQMLDEHIPSNSEGLIKASIAGQSRGCKYDWCQIFLGSDRRQR